MSRLWINIASFQIVWFVSVVYGDMLAMIFTSIALLIHARWVMQHQNEWLLIVAITILGLLWDGLMSWTGVLIFEPSSSIFIPLWLICLWALFASTLSHALAWLRQRLLISAILGAIFGPFSYWAGTRLSATELGSPLQQSLLILAIGWMFIMPLALLMARRIVR